MNIEIRAFETADTPEVLRVLADSLGETPLLRRTPDQFAWKHFDNPFGSSLILVAEAGGRIAGIRAVMRWDLTTPAGETVHCGRMVDTATHPDFQRMGIFRRLTMEAIDVAASAGVKLLFNTPNTRSGAGYLTMGWRRIMDIGILFRPSLRGFRRPDSRLDESLPDVEAFFPGGLDDSRLTIEDRPPRGLRTPRSHHYLSWRFERHPTARYVRIADRGSLAVGRANHRNGRRELVISDLLGSSPEEPLRSMLERGRFDYSVAWFSTGSPERRAATRSGLLPVPGKTALQLMARPLDDLPVDVLDPGQWDAALSDFELL